MAQLIPQQMAVADDGAIITIVVNGSTGAAEIFRGTVGTGGTGAASGSGGTGACAQASTSNQSTAATSGGTFPCPPEQFSWERVLVVAKG